MAVTHAPLPLPPPPPLLSPPVLVAGAYLLFSLMATRQARAAAFSRRHYLLLLRAARGEEAHVDGLLSLLLPEGIIEAVKNSDAASLCFGESFKVRACPQQLAKAHGRTRVLGGASRNHPPFDPPPFSRHLLPRPGRLRSVRGDLALQRAGADR